MLGKRGLKFPDTLDKEYNASTGSRKRDSLRTTKESREKKARYLNLKKSIGNFLLLTFSPGYHVRHDQGFLRGHLFFLFPFFVKTQGTIFYVFLS